ncbi:hypothetical protein R1sor_025205 [Riccia sorocarpa]|uniref:glycerophosphodiester phosphodiesterase n=1 Tax=Riccia sorocarpa TaxID=122646 RepID=A0ABD3G7Y0_9MARC
MIRASVFLFLLSLFLPNSVPVGAAWQTLSGNPPLVIANGGTSGLYPDQTFPAYADALNYSLPGVAFSCDLQLVNTTTGFQQGICRTGLDLSLSTNVNFIFPERNRTYIIDGMNVTGWFAPDFTSDEILNNVSARQSDLTRSPIFDQLNLAILVPELLAPSNFTPTWLNLESPSFFEEHGLNMTSYLLDFLSSPNVLPPDFLSASEITILKDLQSAARAARTKVIFKFLDETATEPTTGQTYGTLLGNLSDVATFAAGILVPKGYIWPRNGNETSLEQHTTLVDDAHSANLEIYAYNFLNDEYPAPYNYSFDPITEILYFIEKYNFSVDGLFTDFPTTASQAIACYANNSIKSTQPGSIDVTIISHNGDSGNWPGSTIPAYNSAIATGVDYIDCSVQITKDGVLICRESPDLVSNTNIATVTTLFTTNLKNYPQLQSKQGVFTFDLTWTQIQSNLKARIFSPTEGLARNPEHDGLYDIITFADFLSLAENNSVGAFIDIQNAVYLRTSQNISVVDAVAVALKAAGYTNSSKKVIIQSEDSSALARLRDLNVTYPLTYLIPYTSLKPVEVTADDFVDIKKYASAVSIARRLVEPLDPVDKTLLLPSKVVEWAHAQNLTAYFYFLRNEQSVFPFDLKADPTMELYMLTERYKVDGFITDFPQTTINYFENHCVASGKGTSNIDFVIPNVEPGLLDLQLYGSFAAPAPTPDLVVPEPPLLGPAPPAPGPSSKPSAAPSRLSTGLFFSAVFPLLLHCLALL